MKRPGQVDSSELKALSARATNAERRLTNAQNQLLATEEKLSAVNQKTSAADNKWEARVKEYEARLKAAEERVKRERQGSKERVVELENNVKCVLSDRFFGLHSAADICVCVPRSLQRQLELAQKRNTQLNEALDVNKGS